MRIGEARTVSTMPLLSVSIPQMELRMTDAKATRAMQLSTQVPSETLNAPRQKLLDELRVIRRQIAVESNMNPDNVFNGEELIQFRTVCL